MLHIYIYIIYIYIYFVTLFVQLQIAFASLQSAFSLQLMKFRNFIDDTKKALVYVLYE